MREIHERNSVLPSYGLWTMLLRVLGGLLSGIGAAIVLGAVALVVYVSYGYYLSSDRLPPGTGVRPMGVCAMYGVAGAASLCIGGTFSILGAGVSMQARFRTGEVLGIVGVKLSWFPLILGPMLMLVSDCLTGVRQSP